MAFFGAPQDLPAAETAAIAGARAVLHALAALNRELSTEGLPELRLGIALAAGDAVVGNVGDQRRHNYTALADAANLAAHLQGIARNFDSDIIATGELVTRQPERWRSLGLGTIKDGRQIEVFGLAHGDLQNSQ
jgi:adenylate cyclase